MQDRKQQDISELLELASDVKSRLRRIENDLAHAGPGEPPEPPPEAGALLRVRNHLELALEALGSPTWGLTAPPAGALQITGFY
jgi:hypothetical protein